MKISAVFSCFYTLSPQFPRSAKDRFSRNIFIVISTPLKYLHLTPRTEMLTYHTAWVAPISPQILFAVCLPSVSGATTA